MTVPLDESVVDGEDDAEVVRVSVGVVVDVVVIVDVGLVITHFVNTPSSYNSTRLNRRPGENRILAETPYICA